jgi:hypothetical protein
MDGCLTCSELFNNCGSCEEGYYLDINDDEEAEEELA